MGGELGGPGVEAPRFRPQRLRGVRGAEPPVYNARLPNGGPGACPWFGRLG